MVAGRTRLGWRTGWATTRAWPLAGRALAPRDAHDWPAAAAPLLDPMRNDGWRCTATKRRLLADRCATLRRVGCAQARWPRDVARDFVRRRANFSCGGRRPAAAPGMLRRCRDGWSDFFLGFGSGLSRAAREVFGPVCDVGPDFDRF
ncbi:hypothetical protein F511_45984 [Dorcoceras hygrometricum]|uniref:Uncharacterized protein n=1 Tax=Dorcoceras hygrometricum TaxID=472368 RepID=A0A2Z6ZVT1_9LAMI|nr:hypothetical protein F511_45984 [Dorcoceras hygrometricum]